MRRRRSEKRLVPLRVLMTLDTVGGIWRFGMDLARALQPRNVCFVFATLGPPPSAAQKEEAQAYGDIVHLPLPLDWLAAKEGDLADIPDRIAALSEHRAADIIHLNLPTQAAGIETDKPVVVMSHSCVPTWFRGLRNTAPPETWEWHTRLNRQGLSRADVVLAPSRSHADLMEATYGTIRNLRVAHNATGAAPHMTERGNRDGVVAVGAGGTKARTALSSISSRRGLTIP